MQFIWLLGFMLCWKGTEAQTYLTSIDPNPGNSFQADKGKMIWSIGEYIYINNGYVDNGAGRRDDLFQIDAKTHEVVKRIALDGPKGDFATTATCLTSDGNMLLTGEWIDYDAQRMRLFVMKLNPNLETLWANFYPDLSPNGYYADGIVEMPDSNQYLVYIVEGLGAPPNTYIELRILKLDDEGTVLWNRMLTDTMFRAYGYGDISATDDGHFLVSSAVNNLYIDPVTGGSYFDNAIVHKIDREAKQVYTKSVGYIYTRAQEPISLALPDGGGVVMWLKDTNTIDPGIAWDFSIMYGFDSTGNRTWTHEWNRVGYRPVYRIKPAANGDILGVGFYLETTPPIYKGRGWLFRMTNTGEVLWERRYSDSLIRPWSINFELLDVCELADGRIAATGIVMDTNEVAGSYNFNVALLVLDADGCLQPGCGEEVQYITSTTAPLFKLSLPVLGVSPNPTWGPLTVVLPEGLSVGNSPYELRCYSYYGQLMLSQAWPLGASNVSISGADFSSGPYILVLYQRGWPVATGKLVVQH
ncbi:MAG: hypothetical protein ACOYNO_09620 [Saprospiraceae bacterium]